MNTDQTNPKPSVNFRAHPWLNIRVAYAWSVLYLAVACLYAAPALAAEPLSVMTFNIRFDGHGNQPSDDPNAWLSTTGEHRRDRVLQVIKAANPDVLGVQEALAHQVHDLASELGGHAYYAAGRDDGAQAGEHCAIFFRRDRFELLNSGTFWLSDQPEVPGSMCLDAACTRIASWVRLGEGNDDELLVVNTHWDHVSQPAREFAAQTILEFLKQNAGDAQVVLLGDMNAHEETPEIKLLLGSDEMPLADSYRELHPDVEESEATFCSFENRTTGKRIDHVLHSPHFKARSAEIIRTIFGGKTASDHFAVLVELE